MHKVFYSWQADTDSRINRFLIQSALERAIQRLALDLELDESTRDKPGSRMIFETIREKIEACAIFVPDVSFMGWSYDGKKRLPNPNVLVEYGYAMAEKGEGQIVPVMNLHFGEIVQLPFDLRHRPIKVVYNLSPDSNPTDLEIKEKIEELASQFQVELRLVFEGGSLFKGLSPAAVRIARYLVDSSETGWGGQVGYEVDELAASLGMTADEANRLLRQLGALGYVERLQIIGTDSPPAIPTDRLFWDFDPLFKGWNPRKDAKTVLETMLSGGRRGESSEALARELSWEIRRINPALRYIVWGHLVLASDELRYPIAVSYMKRNERTEAFVSGIIDPEKLVNRGSF